MDYGNGVDHQPGRVLVVGGTHGNERNGLWLLDQWRQQPGQLQRHGLLIELVVGNPAAAQDNRRYLERDLNRSFRPELLNDPDAQQYEVRRARELLARHGPEGREPCLVAIDLHSTTAAMGNSLVLYNRQPATLALAAVLQRRLGLPIYLHESDLDQSGYLAACWPCALVIEVGPVAQGLVCGRICQQSQIAVETALEALSQAREGALDLGSELVVHGHLSSIDLPRHEDGSPAGLVHPTLQDRDWRPLRAGDPLFLAMDGSMTVLRPEYGAGGENLWPVFINEAAYGEKGIALSLTNREILPVAAGWAASLTELARRLEPHLP
jgi:aspartoacylase